MAALRLRGRRVRERVFSWCRIPARRTASGIPNAMITVTAELRRMVPMTPKRAAPGADAITA
jgi:hypothetical protein